MKILILSKKFPYPLREGEPIATTYLSRSLVRQGCRVSILVMNTTKHFFDPKDLPKSYNHFEKIHTVTVDNQITVSGALRSFLAGKSYILSRFESESFAAKLKSILQAENFDIVQIETPYLSHYIPIIRQFSSAKIAMRAHNVEHEIWQRVAQMTRNPFKKWYLKNQNFQLRKFELERLVDYDVMVAITDRDLGVFKQLGYQNNSVVAPVGIDLSEYNIEQGDNENNSQSIAFIGALDWMPNQDGLIWFLEKVWPKLNKVLPELKLHVAGKNTPDWLRKRATKQIIFHGEVPDAKDFISAHPVLIAPLFSGSGIKIKVLEGMALGRVVVTTPVGAEGIHAKNGEEFLLGENAELFFKNISYCFENKTVAHQIGLAARAFIRREFDNLEIADRVIDTYQKAIANG